MKAAKLRCRAQKLVSFSLHRCSRSKGHGGRHYCNIKGPFSTPCGYRWGTR